MREILFRGKRIDNGEWIYGYYVLDPSGKHRLYWRPFIDATNNSYHFVDHDTVGQYTGLKDKHGKMIFEGDKVIQKYDNEKDCLEIIVEDIRNIQCLYIGSQSKTNEIIGTIHE